MPSVKRIALIGFMGSGKTTLGKHFAELQSLSFADLDSIIEQYNEQSIADIFSKYGESYFRILERETLLRTISTNPPSILSTGGGIPLLSCNMNDLKGLYNVVWIDTPLDIILKRLEDDNIRPLATKDSIRSLYESRVQVYQSADFRLVGSKALEELILDLTTVLISTTRSD